MNESKIQAMTPRFKKGDAFVEMNPHPLVFMEINEVEDSAECMDFCIVTWYMISEKGLNAQRRFSMAARDGKFYGFDPISRKTLKEAKKVMRQFDTEVKALVDSKAVKSRYLDCQNCLNKLVGFEPNMTQTIQQVEIDIPTNQWLDCAEENYWIEEKIKQLHSYIILISIASVSYEEEDGSPFVCLLEQSPFGWETLSKKRAKFMLVEKPQH